MATYKIKYSYETGNSFGSHDEVGELEMEWENLDNAKVALQSIKEHYKWYEDQNNYSYGKRDKKIKEPEWHKGFKYDFQLKVKLDNGNEVEFSAPWCGYFEHLHRAEIFNKIQEDDDMSIAF